MSDARLQSRERGDVWAAASREPGYGV